MLEVHHEIRRGATTGYDIRALARSYFIGDVVVEIWHEDAYATTEVASIGSYDTLFPIMMTFL